jgi:quinoprotein glucose dehydrogenase
MPGFTYLRPPEVNALIAFLKSAPGDVPAVASGSSAPRYSIDGYPTFRDPDGYPAISPPWGTLSAVDLVKGEILWKVPLGEYPELAAKGIRNTGTPNFGGAVATAGGLIFIAATADEKIRAFEKHSGRVLWEWQLPAGGYATPSIYMLDGRQYLAIAAGGGGKNATKSGDAIIAFALGAQETEAPVAAARDAAAADADWVELFDGRTLDGWVHLNGSHTYVVEDGAIVGRTVEGSENSFLCTTREFADFELELETMVDRVTNSGIQVRSTVRPVAHSGDGNHGDFRGANARAGRVNGPQVEIRRYYPGQPTTGILYGEAMGTGWLSSKEKQTEGHRHFIDEGWNRLRIVARGPRIQTWVNGQVIEDLVREDVHRTHPSGFIGLQIHALNGREPGFKEHGLSVSEPLIFRWRNIRIRPLR